LQPVTDASNINANRYAAYIKHTALNAGSKYNYIAHVTNVTLFNITKNCLLF